MVAALTDRAAWGGVDQAVVGPASAAVLRIGHEQTMVLLAHVQLGADVHPSTVAARACRPSRAAARSIVHRQRRRHVRPRPEDLKEISPAPITLAPNSSTNFLGRHFRVGARSRNSDQALVTTILGPRRMPSARLTIPPS